MATKKSSLRQQYNRQINRIRKGYHDIETRGGSFSKSLDEIIKPVKNPTEATIRRLRNITKESLYRQATTDTGKSGYSILAQRRTEAGKRGAIRRQTNEIRWRLYETERGFTVPRAERNLYKQDFTSWNYLKEQEYEHRRWYHNDIEIPRALDKLNKYKQTKENAQFYTTAQKRREWNEQYRQEVQRLFEQGLAENPRLDAVGNFIHLTPEEFKNIGVTGKHIYGKKLTDYSIENAQIFDASTGEIIESSNIGTTPIEVNGVVYQYDSDKHDFYPTRRLTREELKRWYPEQFRDTNSSGIYHEEYDFSGGIYDFDSLEDEYDAYIPSDEPDEERTYPVGDSYDDEDYDVPDFYTDSDGNTYNEEETKDFIDTKLNNIYDRMDALDSFGEQLKEELDSALEEMDDEDKARFLDEYGDDLEASLEAEARYKNDKDGDIRGSERGFNHYHNQSLNIIWNGAVPLTHLNKF